MNKRLEIKERQTFHQPIFYSILFLFSFSCYIKTVCPFIYWKDAGEITSAVFSLGICHPSGYPVYTLLAHWFSRFPFGDIAFRINLFSAVSGALVFPVTYGFLRRMGILSPAAILGALMPVFAHEIWLESNVCEIYSFSLLLIILALFFLSGLAHRDILLAAFFIGLSLAHHLTTLLLLPSMIWLGTKNCIKFRIRVNVSSFLVLIISFSTLLYLPIRSHTDPVADFGNPESFRLFLDHYFTKHYSSKMWPDSLHPIIERLWVVTRLLIKQYGTAITGLILLSLFSALRKSKWRIFLILFIGAHGAFLLYPPDHSFLIPLIFVSGMTIAILANDILLWFRRINFSKYNGFQKRFVVFTFILSGCAFAKNYFYVDKSTHNFACRYSRNVLEPLENNSVIMTAGDNGYSLVRYQQICEKYRDDIHHIHRPEITWSDGLAGNLKQYPEWVETPHPQEKQINYSGLTQHIEAKSKKDFILYLQMLARITGNATDKHNVYWEGGSDVAVFSSCLHPCGLVYTFNSDCTQISDIRHFWLSKIENLILKKNFMNDHNAVSEYSICLFNLSSYYKLSGLDNESLFFQEAAGILWKHQLDPEPHNVIVEGLGNIIGAESSD